MTWSIIARDEKTGNLGIAVASKFFAVGACIPYGASGVGAIATQALLNSLYGTHGLRLLREGMPPEDVVRRLVANDSGQEHRQLHVMDARGTTAAHTGTACVPWCGHIEARHVSIAGNMLAGADILDDTAAAYQANATLPFAQRLVAAMQAGERAGGDKRGKQSAALVIHGEEEWPDLDLRVDDHPDPLAELERLERISREYFVHFRKFVPRRGDPVGVVDRRVIEAGITKALDPRAR
jgi:uncharacterized Ntn-hydrolase superfamily protein